MSKAGSLRGLCVIAGVGLALALGAGPAQGYEIWVANQGLDKIHVIDLSLIHI